MQLMYSRISDENRDWLISNKKRNGIPMSTLMDLALTQLRERTDRDGIWLVLNPEKIKEESDHAQVPSS
jgi:hypothetical protein